VCLGVTQFAHSFITLARLPFSACILLGTQNILSQRKAIWEARRSQVGAGAPKALTHAPPVTRNSLAKCKIKVSNELKVIVHVNISRTHFVQGVRGRGGNNKFVSDTQDTTRRSAQRARRVAVVCVSLLAFASNGNFNGRFN